MIFSKEYELSGTVGSRGQVVIEKAIRDRLGIKQGVHTTQRVVDDHVEIYFLPECGERSLQGVLARYIKKTYPTGEELEKAMENIWATAGQMKESVIYSFDKRFPSEEIEVRS